MKYIYIALLILAFSIHANAVPGTYYNTIDTNKTCANLKTALFQLISTNANVISYGSVDNYYNHTDLKLAESGGGYVIVDRYCSENPNGPDYCSFRYVTGFCLTTPSDTNQCVCYNKEHTFPKSWFGGQNIYPMYSDMHTVWPADNRINFYKGNLPIGYEKNPYYTSRNGSSVGVSDAAKNFGYSSSNIFEPIDTFKGDFARAYLYIVTRYQDSIINWTNRSTASYVLDGNKYPGFKPWILQLCVKWSKMDPPSAFEKQRNDSVYAIQGNRNPYIDYPNWVEKVFGINGSGVCLPTAVRTKNTVSFSVYPNPANNMINIQLSSNFISDNNAMIEIIDMLGQSIFQKPFHLNKEIESIDVSHLSKGMYLLNINNDGQNNVTTFVKQ